jgi:lipopolysaccharide export system permease protein
MIKKIDWYIIKRFLGTYFFSIAIIMSIAIIFDIQEKIDDFKNNNAPLDAIIFDYYVNFVPYFANLFSALFVFIAVIFVTSKMAFDTEIIAILASGVSFNRFLRPYFIASAFLALLALLLIMYVIPESNKVRLDFEDQYVRYKFRNYDRDIHKQVRPGTFVYLESYNVDQEIGYRFSMEKIEDGRLVSKLLSDYIKWDTAVNKWTVYNYYIRDIDGDKEHISRGHKIDTVIHLTPADFKMRTNYVEKMNIVELNEFIETKRLQGADNIDLFLIEKYKRWAFPFSTFILTLIGVCVAQRKRRGGIGANIFIGLILSFSYILFMQISITFSINSNVDPLLSVWIPNILYSVIALILYIRASA